MNIINNPNIFKENKEITNNYEQQIESNNQLTLNGYLSFYMDKEVKFLYKSILPWVLVMGVSPLLILFLMFFYPKLGIVLGVFLGIDLFFVILYGLYIVIKSIYIIIRYFKEKKKNQWQCSLVFVII